MVFLFISYLAIIIVLLCPFNMEIVVFSEEKRPGLFLSFNTLFKSQNNKNNKSINKNKNVNFGLKKDIINKIKNIPKPIFDVLKVEILISDKIPFLMFFFLEFFSEYFNKIVSKRYIGNDSFFVISKGDELYFQVKFTVKFNLFIIFSFLFQIIKLEFRRRNGDNGIIA